MNSWKYLQRMTIVLSLLMPSLGISQSILSEGVFPLKGTSEAQDYASLAEIASQTEILGLGESFHTSEGFHHQRDRIIRFLVAKKGFRTILLETPWAEALTATEYVKSCKGRSDHAVNSLLKIWRSKSIASTLEWLCRYNQTHPMNPVVFAGVDNQNPWADAKIISAYIHKHYKDDFLLEGVNKCVGATSFSLENFKNSQEWDLYINRRRPLPEKDHLQCLSALASLKRVNKNPLVSIALTSLGSWQRRWFFLNRDEQKFINDRDAGMFEIFQELRRIEKADKTILIGHNYHIAMSSNPLPNLTPMGVLLKNEYDARYEAIGLIGYEVKINWPETQFKDQLPPLAANSAESFIHGLGLGNVLIDTQKVFPQSSALIIYNNGRPQSAVLKDQFRALLYLERSDGFSP